MLTTITIRNFAIIERTELEFGAGLTVITGETGAGKSILIDALNLVLGGRASTEVIRSGEDKASVEAVFDVTRAADLRGRLDAYGIETGAELLVRRVLSRSGRHRVYLNGTLATVNMLAEIAGGLVDISGQHEHYSLLRTDFHLDLLDRVAGLDTKRAAVAKAHAAIASIDRELADIEGQERTRLEREEFLKFQLRELEDARLDDPNEEEELEQEAIRLGNAERLRQEALDAEAALYTVDGSAVERLEMAVRAAQALGELDADLKPLADDLHSALAIAEEAARTLGQYAHQISGDPQRLDEIHSRLALFARLRRRFGADLTEVIARRDAMRAELSSLGGMDARIAELKAKRADAGAALVRTAKALTDARKAGAAWLSEAVAGELADLGMPRAISQVAIEPLERGLEFDGRFFSPRGADKVELRFSANPGSPPQPLSKIASGGELSRFMLAVKRIIAERDPVPTYVFDEVDSGVGGPTAVAIGRKLKAVSVRRQALCITHLPQIAALADRHLHVSKNIEGDQTTSEVTELDRNGRIEELARMLGGTAITGTTRAHAEEMLHQGGAA
ncbi:MAG: DNA repair protein RecN [Bradymonadia bacterium]